MKVKFHGIKLKSGRGGCPVCGKHRSKNGTTFRTSWTATLSPSGRSLTFHRGGVYEVTSAEAEFLLSYNGTDMVFEVVDEPDADI